MKFHYELIKNETTYVKYFQSDNLANSTTENVPKYKTYD